MNIADMLNPPQSESSSEVRLLSPPLSPKRLLHYFSHPPVQVIFTNKPRSRFSEIEDSIICQGVANGLTWGQISNQLPHRKRATCFNRYRTLQGIRKSRKRSLYLDDTIPSPPTLSSYSGTSSPSPISTPSPNYSPLLWLGSSPPETSRNDYQIPIEPRNQLVDSGRLQPIRLPPLFSYSIARC
ncbi:Homeodomain-like DNA binding domain-containing transcription factor [Phycomyces blakesleeanus]|uniref:Homeodomain-like DNA binding domain-containing transcription factor n=2 Tax=Phycomyces blakesleeanus TaxID=4837 RepID=A0A167QMV7_PHYB8|nr:Homeodomain-like DNA binding domain-containing transcription factor [Phycomyces blakesleeanus NRRL 1555(-)]OAD79948.1 Homeodomain-like DNA binding domain-containing transcription factor [Phycomyces blakesleeanus NRRL 1555(-)]|eukprot:XP_018297988.1 Homeodomain-like DNA binding domain-containing transcription factor [Phycomyces blakesleeanus NRRL 1555(-)]